MKHSQTFTPDSVVPSKSRFRTLKVVLISVVGVLFFAVLASHAFLNYFDPGKQTLNYHYSKGRQGIYFVHDCSNIIFPSCSYDLIQGADKDTFVVLPASIKPESNEYWQDTLMNTPYAKDSKHVYLYGQEVPNVDASTFVYMGNRNSYDANWYYFEEQSYVESKGQQSSLTKTSKNNGTIPQTQLSDMWQIFPDNVIYNGQIQSNLDPKTLKKFNDCYYEDKNYLIWICYGTPKPALITKDPSSSFKQINDKVSFAVKDKTRVVLDGKVLDGANPATFAFLATDYGSIIGSMSTDGNFVYFRSEKVLEADPKTFTYERCGPSYYLDKNNVYWEYPTKLVILPGIDPKTFKYGMADRFADKHGVYFNNFGQLKLETTDTSNFEPSPCYKELKTSH